MVIINIGKAELKKAFFDTDVNFSREFTVDGEPGENFDTVLLKIMLANCQPKEVA